MKAGELLALLCVLTIFLLILLHIMDVALGTMGVF